MKAKSKGVDLVPRKTYPYQSLRDAISFMVSKPDFLAKCEFWRGRASKVPDNTFADIYDGKIWKEFESERYNHYLQFPGNLLLSLNVDWFQPFSRTRYSVGAIYLVVLNLPREDRYKMENVVLVGIIPGPKEPKLTLNSYLAPLVLELGEAYNGWNIPVKHTQFKAVSVCACLGCVTCDVPATRKVCGFLGHTARLGCSKCLKEFPVAAFGQKPNFASYDRENWAPRSAENHKAICTDLLKASSKTSLRDLEAEHSVRYSCLIQLPHFDPIRFAVVDPMHNLLLGTAKHVLFVWIKKGILLPDDLQLIEERSEQIAFPGDVGRIPTKIGSGFAGFTADQWRIWTTVLSPVVLKGILPNHHLRCWLMFVRACCLLLSRILFKPNITTAERYLLMFCKMFQQLYGDEACTPNMHLHMHLATCLLDYGPVYSFWCFPFERFNGLLGAYHTNKKAIEVQIMKKFLHQQCVKDISFPYGYGEFENLLKRKEDSGSLGESKGMDVTSMMSFATVREFGQLSFQLNSGSKLCSMILPLREKVLASDDFHKLETIYQQLYPRRTISFMSRFYHRCRRITLANEIIGSENERSAVVMAYWPGTGSSLENIDYTRCRVGIIQYFLRHSATFAPSQEHEEHLFCFIRWKQSHPSYDWFGHSATVTSLACEPLSACCYMPVLRIAYRCAYGELSVQFVDKTEKVFVVSPVKLKFCI